jgi:hypothetical protein
VHLNIAHKFYRDAKPSIPPLWMDLAHQNHKLTHLIGSNMNDHLVHGLLNLFNHLAVHQSLQGILFPDTNLEINQFQST